jgi:RNA-binding protein YhbY
VYRHPSCAKIFSTSLDEDSDDNLQDEEDFEMLFKGALKAEQQQKILGPIEKAWRHVKKPLLSIGAKGATFAHGNSLRQLLEAHTVVKVKVNTKQFGKCIIERELASVM